MPDALALALGADSVVVPVRSAAEARASGRVLVQGIAPSTSGPSFRTTKVVAGIELLRVPPSEIAAIIASADFVMASTANFLLAEGRDEALASLTSLRMRFPPAAPR